MDVRNVEAVEPEVEHNGTVPVWWLDPAAGDEGDHRRRIPRARQRVRGGAGGEVFPTRTRRTSSIS